MKKDSRGEGQGEKGTVRSFFAVMLDVPFRERISQVVEYLKAAEADVKWVKKENIHVTLRFLGNVSGERLDELKRCLRETSAGVNPFSLDLGEVSAFPRKNHPRVIWVGLREGDEELSLFSRRLEERIRESGFSPEERPFRAHLTVGRVRSGRNRERLAEKLESAACPPGEIFRVKSISLMQSILQPAGPLYRPLDEAKLRRREE